MPNSAESVLQLLQRFIKCPNRIKQLHSLIITTGHLVSPNPKTKWMNTLLYNALIRAHLNLKDPHTSMLLFTHMLAHPAPPNSHTFPSLLKSLSSSLFPLASVHARPLHAQALKRGVSLDPFVHASFVSLYAQLGFIADAYRVFYEMPQPCVVSCNAMLDGFGRNGEMGSAVSLFERMTERDVFSWTSVVSGFGRNGLFGEGMDFFGKMMRHEDVVMRLVKPNEATFVSVLSCCASFTGAGALNRGRQIHAYIIKNELELTVFMGTALIDLYGKLGCLEATTRLFNEIVLKEVGTWNAMISSLASNGREKQALAMFKEMTRAGGPRPNGITFVTLLTSCARTKQVDLGLDLFQSMARDFSVVPTMEHYGCVVDLLGRAGLLKEAAEFMNEMPFEPDATVLGALLGACKVHGSTQLGNEVGRRLLELQPWHCGRYVVLSNLHAGADGWSCAAKLRKAMLEAGIRKIQAQSWIGY